jgi:hypothetical protein
MRTKQTFVSCINNGIQFQRRDVALPVKRKDSRATVETINAEMRWVKEYRAITTRIFLTTVLGYKPLHFSGRLSL